MNVGVKSTRTVPFSTGDVLHDAEVDERDHRDLRVGDLGERVPDLVGGHHREPAGAERRTDVISSHSSASSASCDAAGNGLDVGERAPESLLGARDEPRAERVVEDAERVRPELVDRLVQPRATLVRREQAVDPHLRVHPVVRLLAVDLGREAGDLRVVGGLQSAAMRISSAVS